MGDTGVPSHKTAAKTAGSTFCNTVPRYTNAIYQPILLREGSCPGTEREQPFLHLKPGSSAWSGASPVCVWQAFCPFPSYYCTLFTHAWSMPAVGCGLSTKLRVWPTGFRAIRPLRPLGLRGFFGTISNLPASHQRSGEVQPISDDAHLAMPCHLADCSRELNP